MHPIVRVGCVRGMALLTGVILCGHGLRSGGVSTSSPGEASVSGQAKTLASEIDAFLDDALLMDMVTPIHEELGNGFFLVEEFRRARFNFMSFTIAGDDYDISGTMKRIARVRAQLREVQERVVFVHTAADVLRAKAAGKMAVALHLEGTECHERDPALVEIYYALGIRHNLLAFNRNNAAGGGCGDLGDGGLTRLGRRFIDEMNRVGMIVDLAHTGDRTVADIIERSTAPVINSHAGVRAIHPHYRNVTDAQIDAIAVSGGVIGISGFSAYLGDVACRSETVFAHVDAIVQRVGPKHVGLGLDYMCSPELLERYIVERGSDEWPVIGGVGYSPIRLFAPQRIGEVVQKMQSAGYDEAAVRGVLGENWLRVMERVWR